MKPYIFIIVIFIAIGILSILLHYPGHNWGDDFALYISQARALCNGDVRTVAANNKFSIDYSSIHNFSPILAPWGFPLLLSPLVILFGIDISMLKILITTFYLLFLFAFYRLLKSKTNRNIALLATFYLGTIYRLLYHTNSILTEFPYLFFAVTTLYLIEKSSNIQVPKKKGIHLFLIGFFIFFAFMLRTEGIFLWIALFAFQIRDFILKRDQKKINLISILKTYSPPYVISLILFLIVSKALPSGFLSHTGNKNSVSLSNAVSSLYFYTSEIQKTLFGKENIFLAITFVSLFIAGLALSFSKNIAIAFYTIATIFVFLFWPFQEARYLIYIIPFILFFIAEGLFHLSKKEEGHFGKLYPLFAPVLFSVLIVNNLLLLFPKIQENIQNKMARGPESIESQKMFDFIQKNTSTKDTVVFFRPRAMTLYTERKSAMIFHDWDDLINKGNYYVVNKSPNTICQFSTSDHFYRSEAFEQHFKHIFENSNFIIYKIVK